MSIVSWWYDVITPMRVNHKHVLYIIAHAYSCDQNHTSTVSNKRNRILAEMQFLQKPNPWEQLSFLGSTNNTGNSNEILQGEQTRPILWLLLLNA